MFKLNETIIYMTKINDATYHLTSEGNVFIIKTTDDPKVFKYSIVSETECGYIKRLYELDNQLSHMDGKK